MGRIVNVLLLLGLLLPTGELFAQSRTVTGRVVDASTREPIPGVNVALRGTMQGTTTGLDGHYSIDVPGSDAVLVFSFVGYRTEEETVGNRSEINVALLEDVILGEDIVVVGYGVQRRQDVTGSVSSVSADDANVGVVTSPLEMMQGRMPGVNIVQNSGEPGAGFVVRVRGGTSITAGNEPLYVIDGVPIDNASNMPGGEGPSGAAASAPRNPLNMINPNDIESITVLKDASAAAIYGSRAANGVVLIQTKQGVAGRVTVDYEGYVAAANPSRGGVELLSASDYDDFVRQQVAAGNLTDAALTNLGGAQTDWFDAVTQTGVSHFHNLAIAGGAPNTQYRASVSYMDQQGIVRNSGLERITGRLNASHSVLNERLQFTLNLQTSVVNHNYGPYEGTGGFEGGIFTNVFAFNPTLPVRAQDGSFFEIAGQRSIRNPVALAEQIDDIGQETRTLGNLEAQIMLLPGLTARLNVGADRAGGLRQTYWPQANPIGADFNGRAIQRQRNRNSTTLQSYLTYDVNLGNGHALDLLGGYEWNEFNNQEFSTEGRDFVSDRLRFDALGAAGTVPRNGTWSWRSQNKLASFFSRANYNYQGRYYLTGVLRYDGSSRFGREHRWALFPAVSGAWRISEEPFLQNVHALSDLRLRVGYGRVGNQEGIGDYEALELLGPSADAVIGGDFVTGIAPTVLANPDLRWEETESYNVGLDYGFLGGKYRGAIEYFYKDTYNLLLAVTLPAPTVVGTQLRNIGEVNNQGIELSFDALALDRDDLSWLLGVIFSAEKNEVVNLGDRDFIATGSISGRGQSGQTSQRIMPDQPLGTFYGPVFLGWDDEGRQLFEDENGNPVTAENAHRKIIGVARPDFTYGFRSQLYAGNFDFGFFLRGEVGRDVFNNTALVYQNKTAVTQNNNFIAEALNDDQAFGEPAVFSSRWIEDGSFLRLETISLGYNMPTQFLGPQVRSARIYASAQNVFVLTNYSGFDPEVHTEAGMAALGIDYTNYPRPRTFTVGVNFGF
ncbi:MAG: SusC/RagA family TonB-linked outer membrane protein [Rhodothermales bacterium]